MGDEVLSQAEIEALLSGAGGGGDAVVAPTPAEPEYMAAAAPEPAVQPAPAPVQPPVIVNTAPDPGVRPVEFAQMAPTQIAGPRNGVELIMDVQLNVAVELGRASLPVRDILALGPGRVVELDKHAGEPVEVVINNKIVARGEVVVIDENFGVRITEIVNGSEKDAQLRAA